MKYLILIVLMLVVFSFAFSLSLSTQALAQVNSTFLTYTNTDLGFTIKYPSDWTVNESGIANDKTVDFKSAASGGFLRVVSINNTGTLTKDEVANYITSNLTAFGSGKLLEVDKDGYFLSGHPAVRAIIGSEQPPLELKTMDYILPIGEKLYHVMYGSTSESFPTYLQTAQSMIDSFQIISKQ
jgi:hypothetical protein